MFSGQYSHQLDNKNRLRMPAKFRAELGSKFLVTKGDYDCLVVISQKMLERLYEKFDKIPFFDTKAQSEMRMLFSQAAEIEDDEQGRFILPQELREFAGINKNIIIVGTGTKVEIWDETRYKQHDPSDQPTNAYNYLAGLGI